MSVLREPRTLWDRLRSLVRARDGHLTRELLRTPGRFGLGQVPAPGRPRRDHGDDLRLLLDRVRPDRPPPRRRGREPHPVGRLPGEPRHGLPQGVGGAHRPGRPRPRHHPPAPRRRRRPAAGRLADRAGDDGRPVQGHPGRARRRLGRLPQHRPDRHRGDGPARARWRSSAWGWSTATATPASAWPRPSSPTSSRSGSTPRPTPTRTSRSPTASSSSARTSASRTRSCGSGVMRNRNKPEIVVIDPRRTETAASATLHLAVRPKSDLVLFYGLANLLIENGWVDRDFVDAHTSGFDDYARFVKRFGLLSVAYETGLDVRAIRNARRRCSTEKKRVSFWWTMGVNQSHQGVRTAQAIINLALLTGNIGRPGTGANSITGQCNAMGSRLFSNTTNLLGGHDFASPERPGQGRPASSTSPRTASPTEMRLGLRPDRRGHPRAARSRASGSSPPTRRTPGSTRATSASCSAGSTSSSSRTCTTRPRRRVAADLLLPAAGWGEKEGTFINSERRFGLIKKVRRAPGQALSDFHIFKLVAHAYGCGEMFDEWESPEAAFQILKRLSAGHALRHHRDRRLPRARRRRGHPVALPARLARPRPAAPAVRRRPVLPPRRPGPVRLREPPADGRGGRRRVPADCC